MSLSKNLYSLRRIGSKENQPWSCIETTSFFYILIISTQLDFQIQISTTELTSSCKISRFGFLVYYSVWSIWIFPLCQNRDNLRLPKKLQILKNLCGLTRVSPYVPTRFLPTKRRNRKASRTEAFWVKTLSTLLLHWNRQKFSKSDIPYSTQFSNSLFNDWLDI